MDMEIFFPGKKKVHARYKGFVVETDQSVTGGGDGSAVNPFDLFLVSIGACAGIFVLSFLQKRGLPTEDARVALHIEMNPENGFVAKIGIEIKLPTGFPDKYRDAVVRAADQCKVKRHFENPPEFETYVTLGG